MNMTLITTLTKIGFLLSTSVLLFACNTEKDGVWEAKGYGILFDIQQGNFTAYQFTSEYCQLFDIEQDLDISKRALFDSSTLSDDGTTLTTTFAGHKIPGMPLTRRASLPETCRSHLLPQQGDVDYSFNPAQELKLFYQTYAEYYAFFDIEKVDWQQQYNNALAKITPHTDRAAFFQILSEMVRPLKDFHVYLEDETLDRAFGVSRKPHYSDIALDNFITLNNLSLPLTAPQEDNFRAYFGQSILTLVNKVERHFSDPDAIKNDKSNSFSWGKINEDTGYIGILTMDVEEIGQKNTVKDNLRVLSNVLDQIFSDLAGSQQLILDIRLNGGGHDFVGQKIMSRLVQKKTHIYSKQSRSGEGRTPMQRVEVLPSSRPGFDGSIAILTSASTASAAETFALSLLYKESTIVIGEATGGGLSDILSKTLPSGISYTLSNEIYSSVYGDEFEGKGIPVTIEKSFFDLEHLMPDDKDHAIGAALAWFDSNR